ncbi:hypothetical protein FNJ87_06305 [Nonlabens mediterrranea]|uniref:WG repeat-containing protein n=1 Tax=Nonlabens mediterrranea TaxID=1419947 RepID=A0ABS0A3L3_9FLAO|nr:hypothetical protein [Nonlabens mediterrranea]
MKLFVLLITLLCSVFVSGQNVVDIEADYLDFIDSDFYIYQEKDENHFNIYEVTFKNSEALLEFSELIHKDSINYHELINVRNNNNSLQSFTKKEEINGEHFYEDDIGLIAFKISNHFAAHMLIDIENSPEVLIEKANEIEIIPLRFNNSLTVFYIPELDNEYLEADTGIIYKIDDSIFFNHKKLDLLQNSNLFIGKKYIIDNRWYSLIENYIDLSETDEVAFVFEEYGVKLDSLNSKFDYSYFVVGFKDSKLKVYNSWLEDITPFSFRDISIYNDYSLQIIQNNKVEFLYITGEMDSQPIEVRQYYCGLARNIYDTEISQVNSNLVLSYYHEFENLKFQSQENLTFEQLDSVYVNKEFRQILDLNHIQNNPNFPNQKLTQYTYFKENQNSFIISKSNRNTYLVTPFGLEYELNDDLYEINHHLVINYKDQVEYIELFYTKAGDVIFTGENNLEGYLGINDKPKYKTLEPFQGNYARFELPNGQKGWLKKDGTEFIDQ